MTDHVDARHRAANIDAHTGRQADTRERALAQRRSAGEGSDGHAGAGAPGALAPDAAADAFVVALGHLADRADLVSGKGFQPGVCRW